MMSEGQKDNSQLIKDAIDQAENIIKKKLKGEIHGPVSMEHASLIDLTKQISWAELYVGTSNGFEGKVIITDQVISQLVVEIEEGNILFPGVNKRDLAVFFDEGPHNKQAKVSFDRLENAVCSYYQTDKNVLKKYREFMMDQLFGS